MSINKRSYLFFLFCIGFCFSCTKKEAPSLPKTGKWRMEMNLNGKVLPFNFTLLKTLEKYEMTIMNAEERISVDDIVVKNDSLFINLPIFESSFFLSIVNAETLKGDWINYYKSDDYKIPVNAHFNVEERFSAKSKNKEGSFGGKYEVTFGEKEDQFKAIGLFNQEGSRVTGTFATETGDYRYLEGIADGDSLFLSTFDGSHAFLFEAKRNGAVIDGVFLSGTHYKETWKAKKNDTITLRNPDSLTYIKAGYSKLSFELENTEGKIVSLEDEQYKGKVTIVQIMGTWCPNCLDETTYLTALYDAHNKEGLEIIALAFEKAKTKEKARKNINALKQKTGANYKILLGGSTRNDNAADALPMLNHIMSYPTAIFIDKKGEIRKIHTGFYGPGTGEYYQTFVDETEQLILQMLKEEI